MSRLKAENYGKIQESANWYPTATRLPVQYLNNSLLEIAHEEGRYTPTTGYEYFRKDHLGNVRPGRRYGEL